MAAAFKDGSVRRIKLVNFMTYRSIEFHPGPKLNLVVGPNGTGKSSLVSALCLGLAGKPTLLGKAEKIGQFVKQGEDVASVEIELVRGEEAVVVRRDLTAAGSSSWSVGGAAASQRHVEDLVASLGIQLHSLGQFLPQEKVGDFAKLSRAERLALMQRSLPSGELLSLHETLTQLQQQRHSLQSTLSSKTSHLEKLQQRQEAQASAIYKFRQWERHNQHITWLTRKRAWVEYEVEVTLYHEVKSRASQALAEKRRLVQAAEPLARTQRDAQQRWHDATHARSHTEKEMAEKVKEIQSLEEILERHSDKVEEEKQTVSRRLADDKDRVTRIQTAVRIIDGWQEELRSLDADQRGSGEGGSGEGVGEGGAGVGEAALKAVSEELAGLGVRTAGMSAERHIVTSRLASLQQDLQRAEARLSRIQDSASRVLERLRSQFPDAVSASLWLAENRDRFSGDIQGPLAITLSPRDEQAACLLENHVSKNDLKTFIFQIDADMETFLTLMRDGKNLRVNAVRAPDKSADEYVPVVPLATITQPGQVLSLTLTTQEQVSALQQLAQEIELDFWHPDSASLLRAGDEAQVRVPASSGAAFERWLQRNPVTHRLIIDDVADRVRRQLDGQSSKSPSTRGAYNYETYHTLDEIYEWATDMAAKHPELVKMTQIGTSSEGRLVPLLTIGRRSSEPKKSVFVDCGIHAREWISTAFCQWFVRELVEGSSATLNRLVEEMTVYVVPVINVDGYAYTWSNNRFWRKTRSRNVGTTCLGTDPNRNWDANWSREGASRRPCDETYCGSAPESEPEVKAVADFMRGHSTSIRAYISMHAYSQLLLLPYASSYEPSQHLQELSELAQRATTALYSLYGTEYRYGPASTTIYLASGGSFDWAHGQGIKYSMTFELRDTGRHGFLLPESLIRPTCQETMAAYEVILDHVLDNPY